jgi:hypothetical protein
MLGKALEAPLECGSLLPLLEFLHSWRRRDARTTTGSNDSQHCGAGFQPAASGSLLPLKTTTRKIDRETRPGSMP